MKKFFPLPLYLLFLFACSALLTPEARAQELTSFILVRHAEQADTEGGDPDLSEEGTSTALRLKKRLEHTNLSAVYSTPYLRTRSTVQDIADSHDLSIMEYDPFDMDVLDRMLNRHGGGIILIVGHSNTTPALVNKLLGADVLDQLDESDYDNLFIVTASEIGNGKLVHLTY